MTRLIRKKGAQSASIISLPDIDEDEAIEFANSFGGLSGQDLAAEVSTEKKYNWSEGSWLSTQVKKKHKVVALDFGVKKNILRLLVDQGCEVEVVPAKTDHKEILSLNPDGLFLSNGPGDP